MTSLLEDVLSQLRCVREQLALCRAESIDFRSEIQEIRHILRGGNEGLYGNQEVMKMDIDLSEKTSPEVEEESMKKSTKNQHQVAKKEKEWKKQSQKRIALLKKSKLEYNAVGRIFGKCNKLTKKIKLPKATFLKREEDGDLKKIVWGKILLKVGKKRQTLDNYLLWLENFKKRKKSP